MLGLDEAQAGIKRNINNLRNADGNKSLLLKVKEESENFSLKLNIQKTKIMVSGPITSWRIDGETMKTMTFLGLQDHCRW